MRAKEVTAPNGTTWSVRRLWIPRIGSETLWGRFRRKFKRSADLATSGNGGCLGDFGDGIAAAIFIILAIILLLVIVLPALVAIIDVLILLLLAAGSLVARVVFRRPWKIEAKSSNGDRQIWRVVGWRASNRRCDEIASLLALGIAPPADSIAR
jgi:hypothetical protein